MRITKSQYSVKPQSIVILLILIKSDLCRCQLINVIFSALSYVTYRWIVDLFRKGAKIDLEESDIYRPLKADNSEKLTDHLEK